MTTLGILPHFLSGQNTGDDLAGNVSQSKVAAVVKVREPLVIQAKQVQDGRVKIVGVNRIDHGLEGNLISGPVRVTGLHAGPGEEGRERPVVVLASLVVGRAVERCTAKLRRPDNQRVVEQAALLQVGQQPVYLSLIHI